MLRELELTDMAWLYGKDFGLAGNDDCLDTIEALVETHLFNWNISPTDEELIHLTVLATVAFLKGFKKGKKARK